MKNKAFIEWLEALSNRIVSDLNGISTVQERVIIIGNDEDNTHLTITLSPRKLYNKPGTIKQHGLLKSITVDTDDYDITCLSSQVILLITKAIIDYQAQGHVKIIVLPF